MNNTKENMLKSIESYLRDRKRDSLYEAFEYIGDSIHIQDLVMAEQDPLYLDYLVVEVMSVVNNWSDIGLSTMIEELEI